MHKIFNAIIMLNNGTSIDDTVFTHNCTSINDRSSHNNSTNTDRHMGSDLSRWMYQTHPINLMLFCNYFPNRIISNTYYKICLTIVQRSQIGTFTQNRKSHTGFYSMIINEINIGISISDCIIGDDFTMASCANNYQTILHK